jgi:hypothetical protein
LAVATIHHRSLDAVTGNKAMCHGQLHREVVISGSSGADRA